MDKHEFDERVDQLKELAKTNNYDQAVDIANSIDWRRVGSASLLSTVSGVYEKIGDYSEAKNILLLVIILKDLSLILLIIILIHLKMFPHNLPCQTY